MTFEGNSVFILERNWNNENNKLAQLGLLDRNYYNSDN